MQRLFSITILLVVLFLVVQSFISSKMSSIEQHKYTVLKKLDGIEIRRYESALFSSVILNQSSYEQSSNNGFRILAGYIFGGNSSGEKIAMTSPVAMELGDSVKMSFMVPSSKSEQDLPTPRNQAIFFEKQASKVMAAIRFGGWASDEKIEAHKKELASVLRANNIKFKGNFCYLGYNPPYKILNRKNEIIVEVEFN